MGLHRKYVKEKIAVATKKPGRRTPLSRERVLTTALRLADRRGIDALSMRNVAYALRVEAMSLYNHVKNKDEILDGIVDLVAAEIALPTIDADWRAAMRRRAISAHEVLVRHPWATMLIVSRANVGPAMLRYVDATIGCLRAAGFSLPLADHAWNAIDSYVYGFTLQKLNFPFEPEEYAEVAAAYLPSLSATEFPNLHALTVLVSERRHAGTHDLELGLDLLLDGLERLRAAQPR